jgi:hypothetical protein
LTKRPDFKKTADGKSYDFYNKPYGVRDWLEKSEPSVANNVVVALIDPDFIFLRPLTLDLRGQSNNIFYRSITPAFVPELIGEGTPVAQLYGLGAPWVQNLFRVRHLRLTLLFALLFLR